MGKSTAKALVLGTAVAAMTFGVGVAFAKGGQRPPDTFDIVNVRASSDPEPSATPSPTLSPTSVVPTPPRTRIPPATPWSSPEVSAAGGQGGGGGAPATPSSKPSPSKKRG